MVINRIGAYNMTQWLQFITYRPRVVMISTEGVPHVIRENENYETMNMLERLPEHLEDLKF
ncbi:MAG: hypothetical protein P1P82_13800 [Bacteroidales bacterium]|nr:hypothetical protein [Bacteroidales bacterium]